MLFRVLKLKWLINTSSELPVGLQVNLISSFNTLNNIYSLFVKKSRMPGSDHETFCHYAVYVGTMRILTGSAGKRDRIPAEFIELQKSVADTGFVELSSGRCHRKTIAQCPDPFVENAFKHGSKTGHRQHQDPHRYRAASVFSSRYKLS